MTDLYSCSDPNCSVLNGQTPNTLYFTRPFCAWLHGCDAFSETWHGVYTYIEYWTYRTLLTPNHHPCIRALPKQLHTIIQGVYTSFSVITVSVFFFFHQRIVRSRVFEWPLTAHSVWALMIRLNGTECRKTSRRLSTLSTNQVQALPDLLTKLMLHLAYLAGESSATKTKKH